MNIDAEEVERQLTIMKNNGEISPVKSCFEDTIKELVKGKLADPCNTSFVDCLGMLCDECIFEDPNLPKTLQILEDNPHIIPIVELLC
jgi:hypothetical protein